MTQTKAQEEWVLLAYRLPRVPSTPRSNVWRKLKRLGVAQLADGLVALPADPRTREQLEWIAEEILEHRGEGTIWLGRPAGQGHEAMVARMTAAVAAEYATVTADAAQAGAGSATDDPVARRRATARLRRELHRIEARDYFPPPERAAAREAVDELAGAAAAPVTR